MLKQELKEVFMLEQQQKSGMTVLAVSKGNLGEGEQEQEQESRSRIRRAVRGYLCSLKPLSTKCMVPEMKESPTHLGKTDLV